MVSFVCDTCNDTLKKPKLDQHAQRCWAVYTCLDCNTTFEGTSYRAHTSCISEDQKYQKSVYKAPKKPNKNHPGAPPTPAPTTPATAAPSITVPEHSSTATPVDTPAVVESSSTTATTNGTKRPRQEEQEEKDEADKLKKQRKAEKKAAKKASKAAASATGTEPTATSTPAAKAEETAAPEPASEEVSTKDIKAEIKAFLAKAVPEVLKQPRTLGEVKRSVMEMAAARGLNGETEVLEAFEKGVFLGGDKPKKMLKLSFE
ncbi:BZ3500_MvSof-1268-A1-R1_Chr2-2g05181 [Microbotryum saponariae]|uniref:BZ3500_MvSof-1268-A1-R1_Chr2-2g05181 protein n=1 Tax=Microbotryum saponariae TaxID=289078 RepID=A0A2X0L8L1_9BASI|nr:BZ3500_MvSof-1268-A1-R1_Chr2-2g05181 [Microbotryum saponariae]SDA01008.1 BZ3501_MvSof-1269-A2-R1_Chr2-2g04855 [Microbotryum saponariae]